MAKIEKDAIMPFNLTGKGERNMPKKLHDALAREAKKKGLKGEEFDAYVYGTLAKVEKKAKGKKKK